MNIISTCALILLFLSMYFGCTRKSDTFRNDSLIQDSIIWYKQANVELGNRIKLFDINSGIAISRGKGGDIPGIFYVYNERKWNEKYSFSYSDFPLLSKYSNDSLWFIIHETHHGFYKPRHYVFSNGKVSEIKLPIVMWDQTDFSMWKGLHVLENGTAWMVGQQGNILYFDKNSWQEYPSPVKRESNENLTTGDLNDVFMLSTESGWAIGRDGIIIRFKNGKWEKFDSPTTSQLNRIFMTDESNGWIVGLRGTLLQFDGIDWKRIVLPTQENLYTVKALDRNKAWIAGSKSTLFELNQKEWFPINSIKTYNDEFADMDIVLDSLGNTFFWLIGNAGIYTNFQAIDFSFTDITSQAGLPREGNSGFFLNVNNNDFPDLLISNEEAPGKLFLNNKNYFVEHLYTELKPDNELVSRIFGGGDLNNDGNNDIIEIKIDGSISLLKGDGNGNFDAYSDLSGLSLGYIEPGTNISVNLIDLNNDGNLDVYISNFNNPDILLANDGNGHFENVYGESGINKFLKHESYGTVFSDLNSDGLVDFLIMYKYPDSDKHLDLFINKGNFKFERKDDPNFYSKVSPVSYSAIAVDLNNDLFTDLVIHNNKIPTKVMLNNGDATFRDESETLGFTETIFHPAPSNGILIAEDFNNDGWIDLFISSKLFLNNKGKGFVDITELSGISFIGDPSASDFENDGDIDLFIGSSKNALGEGIRTTLYRNNLNPKNYIKVKLMPDISNRNGIGTKLILEQKDSTGKVVNRTLRENGLGSNPLIQRDFSSINFAMPDGYNYSLKIIFPSGKEKYLENIVPGESISVKESGGLAHQWFLFIKSLYRIFKSVDLTVEITKLLILILMFFSLLLLAEKKKYNLIVKKSVWILLIILFYLLLFYNYYNLTPFTSLALTFFPSLFVFAVLLFISHKIVEKKKSQYISHFKLIEVLGMGGMGKVYKAIDINTNSIVAIKVLNPELMKSDENRKRISDEGRILTGLNHPNIVKVIEVGETEYTSFVAMEYLPGGTLESYIKKHFPLSFETIRDFIIQICNGLKEIHSKKIVHRDLKTSNIMLDADDKLRIMDFGLSKSPLISTMTSLGTALGTLGYVAPEQITNSNVDNRTDIFSLGVILYEMITNSLPFKGENEIAMIHSIFNTHPSNPCELNHLIPNFAGEIVLKCLQKDINERYNSVSQIISAINKGL